MPSGRVDVTSTRAAGVIVMLSGPEIVREGLPESVTFTVRGEVPATVGVPFTTQPALMVSPAGSVPPVTVQLYGPVPPATPTVAL